MAVGDFNGDGHPDIAVANHIGRAVTVLLNAADWGAPPAPASSGKPDLHRPVASQAPIEPVATPFAVRKSQSDNPLSLTSTDLPPDAMRQSPVQRETGQPAQPEAALTSTPTLTARQREVAALIAEGCTNRQIGERLGIAERSAEAHVERIRYRMDFRSRAQIAAWYVATGGPN